MPPEEVGLAKNRLDTPNELELRPNRFGRYTPVLVFAAAAGCAWEALSLPEADFGLVIALVALAVILPLFTLGYVRNERLFVNRDVVGIDTFFGRHRTVARDDVKAFSTAATLWPSLTLYGLDGGRIVRLSPAVFTRRQTELLRTVLGLPPQVPQPGIPMRMEIEPSSGGLILRPSADITWKVMFTFIWIGAAFIVLGGILVPASLGESIVGVLGVLAIAGVGISVYSNNAQIFADSLVVGTRDILGFRHTLSRDQVGSIDIGNRGALVFTRNDGRRAFSVNGNWWTNEQVKALTDFLATPDITSEAYKAEWLRRGMRPPKRG